MPPNPPDAELRVRPASHGRVYPASDAMPGSEDELDRGLAVQGDVPIDCRGLAQGMTVASCTSA